MSQVATYRCDVCGKLRESDANRWWLLRRDEERPREMIVAPFDARLAAQPDIFHACGEQHGLELVARWFATGSFDKVAIASPAEG